MDSNLIKAWDMIGFEDYEPAVLHTQPCCLKMLRVKPLKIYGESWRQWARKENLKVQPTRDKTKGKIRTLIKNITNREEWIKAWELIKNITAITRREYQIQTELMEKGIDYPNDKEPTCLSVCLSV